MTLTEKIEEVKEMYKDISLLLNALPHEESQLIQDEINDKEVLTKLEETQNMYRQLLSKTELLYCQLDTFHSELLDRLSVQRLLTRQSHYVPVLANLIDMVPEDENHKDIVWVRKWLVQPELNLEEAAYFFIYAARSAAEVLAIKCHVLTDQWEQIVLDLLPLFETFFKQCDKYLAHTYSSDKHHRLVSSRFNIWIIRVIEDPEMCPNSNIRLKMLFFYKLLIIDDDNKKQSLSSFFSVFISLNKHQVSDADPLTKDICNFLNIFNHCLANNYLFEFGKQLADKLRQHRKTRKLILMQDISYDYAMGLKTTTEPWEILGLTAILKYISDGTDIYYKAFCENANGVRYIAKIDEAFNILDMIIYNFKEALEEPEMLYVTAECIMNTMENAVQSKYQQYMNENEVIFEDDAATIDDLMCVTLVFRELANDPDNPDLGPGRVGQEIIRRYKERICRLRSQIPRVFMEGCYSLIPILYYDEY